MKKMIKNLMLVAVAAMAFVGCQNDNDEMNVTTRKVVLHFVAGFDEDTRATFGDKDGDTNTYPTYWEGNEWVSVTISDGENVFRSNGSVELPEGEETSRNAKISVEFNLEEGQALPAAGTITATVGSFDYNTGEVSISTNQSSTEKSVESMSLIATREYTNGNITGEALAFKHAAAYGKMTLSQFADDAADITKVKVTINDNETIEITPNNGETKLTTPTIWFTTYGGDIETPIEVETLVVEATVGGGVYTRTIDMTDPKITKPLKFITGRVSAFEVTALTAKEPDYSYSFNKFVAIGETTDHNGTYYTFRFTNDEYEEMVIAFHTADVVDGQLPIGTFEIDEQLVEGSVYGNGSYFDNIIGIDSPYPLYFGGGPGTVTIALEDGTYSVEVSMPSAYFVQADQYVKATCEYNPTAVTVEGRWYTYDTREFGLTFKVGGSTVLTIIGYSDMNDAILSEGEYTVSADQVAMNIIGDWCYPYLKADGTMTIEHLEDGYRIVINAVDKSDNAHSYTYEGPVISADKPFNPGDPTPIAAPENLEATVSGSTITLTWDAVTGAQDYTVSWNGGSESRTVTEEQCVIEGLNSMTTYYFEVVANPSDTENNVSSKAAQVNATTGIDKSATGDFNYTYDAYTDLGSKCYKFYNSSNTSEYLLLNFSDDIKTLEAGSYTYAVYDGIESGAESAFNIPEHPNGDYVAHWIQEANIVYVDVAEDNTFTITVFCKRFIAGTYNSNALYKGVWSGKFAAPLATPTVTATVQNTNEIVVTWEAVANAASYTVSCPGEDDQVVDAASELTATFTGLSYNTEYTVSVVANPAVDASYIKSEAGTATVETGDGVDLGTVFTTATGTATGEYNYYSVQFYDIYFKTADQSTIAWYRIPLAGNCLEEMLYSTSYNWDQNGYVTNGSWTGVGQAWPLEMTVAVVDGQYSISLRAVDYNDNYKEYTGTFVGQITGFTVPGAEPQQLDTPTGLVATATANTVTVSWSAVANAESYDVTCGAELQNVTGTTATFDGLEAGAEYNISVVAKADGYEDSPAASTTVITEDAVEPDSIVLTTITPLNETFDTDYYTWSFNFTDGTDNNKFAIAFFYNKASATSIVPGEYTFASSISQVNAANFALDGRNPYYFEGINKKLTTGSTVNVAVDGSVYTINMHFILTDGSEHDYKYVGEIGVDEPEPEPQQLDTPTGLEATSTTNTVTVSWNAVANAESYYVTCGGESQTVTTTTATFTDLTADTEYTVTVVAKATNGYEDSLAASIPVTTQKGAVVEPETVTVTKMSYTQNGSVYTFTYTCANGTTITGTSLTLSAGVTYALSTSTDVVFNTLSNIKVGSTVATSVSGTITIDGSANITFNNVVIDGVQYVGSFPF